MCEPGGCLSSGSAGVAWGQCVAPPDLSPWHPQSTTPGPPHGKVLLQLGLARPVQPPSFRYISCIAQRTADMAGRGRGSSAMWKRLSLCNSSAHRHCAQSWVAPSTGRSPLPTVDPYAPLSIQGGRCSSPDTRFPWVPSPCVVFFTLSSAMVPQAALCPTVPGALLKLSPIPEGTQPWVGTASQDVHLAGPPRVPQMLVGSPQP